MKSLSKCPSSTNLPFPFHLTLPPFLPCKISGCAPTLRHYSFCKTLHFFKCFTMFWIRLCLNNCSVNCTVILCYVLHQTHSEFWHIQHSVFSGIYQHIESYSASLRHIHAYWDIIKAYSGLLRHTRIFTTLPYSEP